jgi:hypothetical protein
MRLVTGFWSFKTFAAAIEPDLFTRLAGGRTVTVREARAELGLAERPTDLLLAACASLGLLEKVGDGYRNSELAEEFLVTGRPYYFGGQVRYCDERTYLPWHRLGEALRTNRPLTWDPQAQESLFGTADPAMLALFWEAMYSTSSFTARSPRRTTSAGTADSSMSAAARRPSRSNCAGGIRICARRFSTSRTSAPWPTKRSPRPAGLERSTRSAVTSRRIRRCQPGMTSSC